MLSLAYSSEKRRGDVYLSPPFCQAGIFYRPREAVPNGVFLQHIVVMGISGNGKTTVGRRLRKDLAGDSSKATASIRRRTWALAEGAGEGNRQRRGGRPAFRGPVAPP
jgi:hypothetical protein